jgi:glutamine amidotransferase
MGWNQVQAPIKSMLFQGLDGQRFYFVHSYARVFDRNNSNQSNNSNDSGSIDYLAASSEHGQKFLAALEYGSLSATQFHPEKSGSAGLRLLVNWVGSLSEF